MGFLSQVALRPRPPQPEFRRSEKEMGFIFIN